MGILSGVKNTFKKSEAAVVVQNLLEMLANTGMFSGDPAATGNTLIASVWDKAPHLFDGRFGQRPHKLSVAAAALADAIEILPEGHDKRYSFILALGNILNEVSVNGNLYPLNSLDHQLLENAATVMTVAAESFNNSPMGREISGLLDEQ